MTRDTISRVRPGPKPRLDETRFIPANEEQERQLIAALIATGTGRTQAVNIATTLGSLPRRTRLDNATSANLSLYRKRLAVLVTPPWEWEDPPRPSLRLSVLLGGASPTGAIGGQFNSARRGPRNRRPGGGRRARRLLAA